MPKTRATFNLFCSGMGTTHVNADMCWKIDWYGEDVSDDLHFYMLGYWE